MVKASDLRSRDHSLSKLAYYIHWAVVHRRNHYNVCDLYRNVLFTQRYTVISVVADVGPCLESFDGVPGYIPENFNEGELRYGVTTVGDCQIACHDDPFCIRFSYITDISLVNYDSNRVCYLFNSRVPLFILNPGGRVYFRRKCVFFDVCAQTTTSKSRQE